MARGSRKPLDEQIQEIEAQIEVFQSKKAELIKRRKEEETTKIYDYLQKNNISAEEAMKIISEKIS